MGIENEIGHLGLLLRGGSGIIANASFTPAAAAYSAGDVIGVAQEFVFRFGNGDAIPSGALIRVLSTVIKIDEAAIISGETSYSLPLFSVTPPSARADNAAYAPVSGDLAAYRGILALGTPVDLGGFCYVKTQFTDLQDFNLAGTSLFGELVTAGGATFTAVARQVALLGIVL